MLAPSPASMLNQTSPDKGIPYRLSLKPSRSSGCARGQSTGCPAAAPLARLILRNSTEGGMPRQYRLMSADGHLEVPPERWIHRVPEKHRDRAPHTVHLPDGGDALMIEGQPLLEANFLDLRAGRSEGTWQPFGFKVADAAGTGGPEQ